MRLKEVLCRQPASIIQSYQYLERYVNNGSPSGENRTVSQPYSPIDGMDSFPLPSVSLPIEQVQLIGNEPSQRALATVEANTGTSSQVRFFLHPDMAEKLGVNSTQTNFAVFPTSSGRTVCRNDPESATFLKLHYDGMLGRIVRKMGKDKVVESVFFSEDLDRLHAQGITSERFDFFPETLGVVATLKGEEYGFIVRDFNSRHQEGTQVLARIPWFSLFSQDKYNPTDPTLLKQWIESRAGKDIAQARKYLFTNFIEPVIDCYVFLST